jgi:hypothetical protein
LLPLSDKLSPNTTSELYGLAAAGRTASVTAAKVNAGSSALTNDTRFMDVPLNFYFTPQHCIAFRVLRQLFAATSSSFGNLRCIAFNAALQWAARRRKRPPEGGLRPLTNPVDFRRGFVLRIAG